MKLGERKLFYGEFLRDAPGIGSVTPSSKRLARAVTAEIQNRNGSCRILEAGAGTGVITQEILKHLRDDDSLDIYELNSRFVLHLEQKVLNNGHRGHVQLFHEDVLTVPVDRKYHHVVCGIPVNNMPVEQVRSLFDVFFDRLVPGGCVSFYQYIGSRPLQAMIVGRTGRRRLKEVGRYMRSLLREHEYRRTAVIRNVPPAFAHHLRLLDGES